MSGHERRWVLDRSPQPGADLEVQMGTGTVTFAPFERHRLAGFDLVADLHQLGLAVAVAGSEVQRYRIRR